jgi:hypothetical protein
MIGLVSAVPLTGLPSREPRGQARQDSLSTMIEEGKFRKKGKESSASIVNTEKLRAEPRPPPPHVPCNFGIATLQ